MANPVELLPLLIVALVLLGAGGADVATITVAVDGDRTVTDVDDVFIVGGGTASVPAGDRVEGSLYVIGGDVTVAGTVDGDVVQLAGTLTVTETAAITGTLETYAGDHRVADGAAVARRTDVPGAVTPRQRSPLDRLGWLALQAALVALVAGGLARHNPDRLRTVGESVVEHPLVSSTVGLLAMATGVAVAVFMAITVILLPVSVLALLVGALTVGYAYVVFGYLVGRRLPLADPGRATAAGAVAVVVGMWLLGRVPVVGSVVQLGLVLTGVGAVLLTYYGLREFEPVALPD